MRTLAWLAGVPAAAILLLYGVILLFAECSGEVVKLRTTDASGASVETRLWIVDDSGVSWLFAAGPDRSWLEQLRRRPEVQVVRGEQVLRFRAVPVETDEARQRILWLVVKRYGLALHGLALIHHALLGHPTTGAVPIRLEPLEANAGSGRL